MAACVASPPAMGAVHGHSAYPAPPFLCHKGISSLEFTVCTLLGGGGGGRPGGGKSKSMGERKDPECQAPHPVLSLLCLVLSLLCLTPLGRLGDSDQTQGLDQVVSGVQA